VHGDPESVDPYRYAVVAPSASVDVATLGSKAVAVVAAQYVNDEIVKLRLSQSPVPGVGNENVASTFLLHSSEPADAGSGGTKPSAGSAVAA